LKLIIKLNLVLLTLCLGITGLLPALARTLPTSEQIAFVSNRAGRSAIYIMDVDHGLAQRLTSPRAYAYSPDWSPDGQRIAFGANYEQSNDIYVMDAAGRPIQRLTSHPADDGGPVWSPDGKWLVFYSNRRRNNYDLYILPTTCIGVSNSCDQQTRRITALRGDDYTPRWSPDSQQIVFVSRGRGTGYLYTVSPSGKDLQRLATLDDNRNILVQFPEWAQAADRPPLFSARRAGNWDLYMTVGAADRRLTYDPADDGSPVWRPS
jgi:TolB protein